MEREAGQGALSGVRVLELASYVAGPFAGALLGEFGAEVIKVEDPRGGAPMRRVGYGEGGYSYWFAVEGRNKRSITLDLRHPEGRRVFLELVALSDVVIENFRPGTLEERGLGDATLRSANPGLIVAHISGFGQDGPHRDRPGYDGLALAFSGVMSLIGDPERLDQPPLRPAIAIADYSAGLFTALGVLLALRARDGDPEHRGQTVELALYEPLLRMLGDFLPLYGRQGVVAGRQGHRSHAAVPSGCYRTLDGQWVVVRVVSDQQWGRFARAIGRPDWAEDGTLASVAGRLERREEIEAATAAWVAERRAEEVEELLLAAGIVAGRVNSIADLFDDPQVRWRGSIVWVDDPVIGALPVPNVVPRLERTPGRVGPAPRLGEANEYVYGELLGYPAAKIEQLRRQGVI